MTWRSTSSASSATVDGEAGPKRRIALNLHITFLPREGWPHRLLATRRLLTGPELDIVHTILSDANLVGRLAAAGLHVSILTSFVNLLRLRCVADPSARSVDVRVIGTLKDLKRNNPVMHVMTV